MKFKTTLLVMLTLIVFCSTFVSASMYLSDQGTGVAVGLAADAGPAGGRWPIAAADGRGSHPNRSRFCPHLPGPGSARQRFGTFVPQGRVPATQPGQGGGSGCFHEKTV